MILHLSYDINNIAALVFPPLRFQQLVLERNNPIKHDVHSEVYAIIIVTRDGSVNHWRYEAKGDLTAIYSIPEPDSKTIIGFHGTNIKRSGPYCKAERVSLCITIRTNI